MAEWVFWIAGGTVLYAFLGYPLVLLALRRAIHREVRKAPVWPFVSLLIPAYNEARVIARKIENSLALDYPAGKIEIVVVSDGSTDRTVEIAAATAARRPGGGAAAGGASGSVRVLAFTKNRGKMAALNAAVPQLRGEIVVFSDASAALAPDAIRRLVENFADPEVGAVCGRYTVVKPNEVNIGAPENLYWKYEAFLKTLESRLGSTLGAHGHLHAIRRELYSFPPAETINDDYVIPLSVLARGLRAVYEPAAIVFEEAREMTGFGRRIRIVAGNLQQLRHLGQFLAPCRPLPLLFFLSHKVVRLLVPFAMLTALGANLLLAPAEGYRLVLGAQLVFYILAALGVTGRLRPRALRLPFYFCMVNSAAFFGLYHALTRRRVAWR
jgi:cellulose synthase/poly-beta-1,6-N-acetylglucosamine synthase-like glycosyltransferase